jgi:hypothetical protein
MSRSTHEEWAARVARWKDSGLTAKDFASEVGVSARSLVWWRWRLSKGAEWEARTRPQRTRARRTRAPIAKTPTAISPLTFVEMPAVMDADPLEVVIGP